MANDKGKAAILLLLLVGGGVALASSAGAKDKAAPPKPKDLPPYPPPIVPPVVPPFVPPVVPPSIVPPPPPPPPAVPANAPPITLKDLPPVAYAQKLIDGTASAEEQQDFILRYEVDPAALYSWALGGPLGGAGAMATSPGARDALLARARQAIAAIKNAGPPVSNQVAALFQYDRYAPNPAWPNYLRVTASGWGVAPSYLIDRNAGAPLPDQGMPDNYAAAWTLYVCDFANLANVLEGLNEFDQKGYPVAAQVIANRLAAEFVVYALLGFAPPPITIPPKFGGNPPIPGIGGGVPGAGGDVAPMMFQTRAATRGVRGRY